jgi:hypothetical protein
MAGVRLFDAKFTNNKGEECQKAKIAQIAGFPGMS